MILEFCTLRRPHSETLTHLSTGGRYYHTYYVARPSQAHACVASQPAAAEPEMSHTGHFLVVAEKREAPGDKEHKIPKHANTYS